MSGVEVSCTSANRAATNSDQLTRIMVISLAASTERRAAFTARANNSAVSWEFFDACTEISPSLTYDERKLKLRRSLTESEIGVYSSHYSLWEQLLRDDVKQYIILEDDVIVDWKMIERLFNIDFDSCGISYLRLFYKRPVPFSVIKSSYLSRSSFILQLKGRADGAQAYIVTRAAAERLIRYCRRIERPIDSALDRYWEHGVANLCLFPFAVIEEYGDSTIGNERFRARFKPVRRDFTTRFSSRLRSVLDEAKRRAWLIRRPPAVRDLGDSAEFWR